MGNTNGVCCVHGLGVVKKHKWNHDEDRSAGTYYRCPKYGECGSYYCLKTGVMMRSKKITGKESE